MQKPTSDAHSNTYSINANFEGISYTYHVHDISVVLADRSGSQSLPFGFSGLLHGGSGQDAIEPGTR